MNELLAMWKECYEGHKHDFEKMRQDGKAATTDADVCWAYMNAYQACIEDLEEVLAKEAKP